MAGPSFGPSYGGSGDGFVARLSTDGDQLLSSTYLGTGSLDEVFFVSVDASDNIFALGHSAGGAYPITPGKYGNAGSPTFIQKLSPDLSTGYWSTVIGNGTSTGISPVAFRVDQAGRILLCGFGSGLPGFSAATTLGFPITPDAIQLETGDKDWYIAALAPEALSLAYGTFLGSTATDHVDAGMSRFSEVGDLYLGGCAGCGPTPSFPTTSGAWSETSSANCPVAFVKVSMDGTTAVPGSVGHRGALVWPNPADAWVWIKGCDAPTCEVVVTDALGRVVLRTSATVTPLELYVAGLTSGVYHVRIDAGSGSIRGRFVVN